MLLTARNPTKNVLLADTYCNERRIFQGLSRVESLLLADWVEPDQVVDPARPVIFERTS